MKRYIIPFEQLEMKDVSLVGGKNASLGEMTKNLSSLGIAVPDGFAVTVDAYHDFLAFNAISPRIQFVLNRLDRITLRNLSEVGEECRSIVMGGFLPKDVNEQLLKAYRQLEHKKGKEISVAVRSSATAEDSPTASFAGQHDSFLNVRGEDELLLAVKKSFASLYNDRAIKYRIDHGFSDMQVGQSVGVQLMVRSDRACAGVAFTIEPENGNGNLIYITGAWGLGESVVQGAVNTDEFYAFKPALDKGLKAIIWRNLGSKDSMMVYSENGTSMQPTPPNLREQF